MPGNAAERATTTETRGLQKKATALIQTIHERILKPLRAEQVGELALEKIQSQRQRKTVVVVGEIDRGKSALTNALVGIHPGSPEGIDFTTAVPVAVGQSTQHDPSQSLTDKAVLYYSNNHRLVDVAELNLHIGKGDFETTGSGHRPYGLPMPTANTEDAPTRAFIPVSSSAMKDIVVIDTPGVGGINSGFNDLVQSNAEQACALIIACDASTPITKPEMDFINEVSKSLDSVVVAVTKIDKHLGRWKQIVANDQELLRQHTGRDFPVIGVSSLLATYQAADYSTESERLRELSGIENLRETVFDFFNHDELLPTLDALRMVSQALKKLRAEQVKKISTLKEGANALPQLNSELEDLQSLKRELEQWQHYLNRDLTNLRQQTATYVDEQFNAVRTEWIEAIGKKGMAVLRKNPQYFSAQIEKDFQQAVFTSVNYFAEQLRDSIVSPLFESPEIWSTIEKEIADSVKVDALQTGEVRKKSEDLMDPMMLMMGFSGGSAISGILVGLGATAFTGVGAVAGVGWIAFNMGFRAMKRGKTNLTTWIKESTNTAKIFTNRTIDGILNRARPVIVIQYQTSLKEKIQKTEEEIRNAKAASQRSQMNLKNRLETLNSNVELLDKQIKNVEGLITQIRQAMN